MSTKQNGRVDLGDRQQPQPRYENNSTPSNYVNDVVKGNIAINPVSELFFSDTNISALQHGIKTMVLNKSCGKHVIGNQSTDELLVIMRATYLKESVNSLFDVVGQVKTLNESVLKYSVPRIMNELKIYNTFIHDISVLPVPMRYGESTNVAGSKTLELKPFF